MRPITRVMRAMGVRRAFALVAAATMATGVFTLAEGSVAQARVAHVSPCPGGAAETVFEAQPPNPNYVQGQPVAFARSMVTFLNRSVSNNVTIDNYSRVRFDASSGNHVEVCGNGSLIFLTNTPTSDITSANNTIDLHGVGNTFNGNGAQNQFVVASGNDNTITSSATSHFALTVEGNNNKITVLQTPIATDNIDVTGSGMTIVCTVNGCYS